MKKFVVAAVACALSLGGLSAGSADAWGSSQFNCNGYASGTSTFSDYSASTYRAIAQPCAFGSGIPGGPMGRGRMVTLDTFT